MKPSIDTEIADQAEAIRKLEADVKDSTADLRQQLKDYRKQLNKLLDEKQSGQLSLPGVEA